MSEESTTDDVGAAIEGAGELEEKEGYVRCYLTDELVEATPEEVEARQVFLKRLIEEYDYPKDHIEKEFTIKKGSKTIGPADIAVFHGDDHSLDNIHIIVETKREERTDGIDQLKSYLSPTKANFGVWFNGNEVEYLQNRDTPPYFREIPDIPKDGQTLDEIGTYRKEDLEPASDLKSVFESIHNHIYATEGLSSERVFHEMLKVIFIKLVDEKSGSAKCDFRITDEEMEKIQNDEETAFVGRIEDTFERVKGEYSDVFDEHDKLDLGPSSLAFAVSQLQKYSLSDTDAEVKGTAFQTFIKPVQRENRGQFFTPQPVLRLAVKCLNPQDGELVLDPACGSGGFLIETLKHVEDKFRENRPNVDESELRDMLVRYAQNYIRGLDINPDLARVAKMYMVLYGDGHSGIFSEDALEDFSVIKESAQKAGANGRVDEDSFDIILTNPPFGTEGKITNKRQLRNFDLGFKWKKDSSSGNHEKTHDLQKNGQTPEILFIERCLQFLKPGGRMGIVLPDGILTNKTARYVREFIRQNARILGVVSLPIGTFKQSGSNPKTSVLFLQKLTEEELEEKKEEDYDIFMSIADDIGYELDKQSPETKYKRNNKGEVVKDEEGNPIIMTDIPEIIDGFRGFKKQNDFSF
ncbi:restriction endonuclease subunit M [Natrinema sp. LN54]|uniref:restriction endonuclease subunit M n=1 Tax=Natrinema sp. LN54 TaxID=3458705 RepID=UPI0040351944